MSFLSKMASLFLISEMPIISRWNVSEFLMIFPTMRLIFEWRFHGALCAVEWSHCSSILPSDWHFLQT